MSYALPYTLPCNPFSLLSIAKIDKKGLNDFYVDSMSNGSSNLGYYGSGNIYYSYNGIPTPFIIRAKTFDEATNRSSRTYGN